MKQLTCEMCGSTDLIKDGGVFVCQTCGCKYSIEEAKKMMIEGTVEVVGTVKVDNTSAIENYLDMARNALDAGNNKEADEYCNRIIEMDTTNWEAWFIKGKAVGWQSTLGNVRISETINAFSKALDNCPEDKKKGLGEQCQQELEKLHTALLSLRVKNFKTHPNDRDLQGLRSDIQTILDGTVGFLLKAQILVDTGNIKYGRVINNGLCAAWSVVYKDYKGDEGHPSDYNFRRLISEGDTLIEAFKLPLVLLGTTYDDKDKNSLIIQIYKNMIDLNEKIRDSCSYNVSYSNGVKSYYINLTLTAQAKAARNAKIAQWREKIQEVETIGAQKAAEAAQKRYNEYWEKHAEEKAELDSERDRLLEEKDRIDSDIAEIENKYTAKRTLEELNEKISALKQQKQALGFLKGKEKKALQEQIDAVEREAAEVQKQVEQQQPAFEEAMAPLRAKLESICNRISEISEELTKDR